MSTYVLMRILESVPQRYDRGIRLLTLGRLDSVYDRLSTRIGAGQRVLDLGCGTGALALRAARRGARVRAIDTNIAMLEIAERRARAANLEAQVVFREMGVAELDNEAADNYDVVTSGLCLSELSEDELRYTLGHVRRILKPGGLLLIVDEVRPPSLGRRIVYALIRAPLAAVTYLITQQTTHPVTALPQRLADAGLSVEAADWSVLGSLIALVGRKPGAAA
jgi:ubiquinone/menaquinone biosynthesis C-methylase UbiE